MITSENAREYQRKGVEVRRLNHERLLTAAYNAKIAEMVAGLPDISRVITPPTDPDAVRVRAKLQSLMDAMDESDDPRELDALSRAYDRLFRAWMVLSNTPGPGQRKPSSTRQPRQPAGPGYTIPEVVPDPQPANPAQPEQDKPAL